MTDPTQAEPPNGEADRNDSIVTRLMQAGNDEADALLEALGMRAQLSGEAQDIARLIERRLAEIAWGDHSHALDQLEIQRAFLAHRFIEPMRMYERSLRGYSALDNFLNLTSILAGVGASLAAALNAPKAYAIVGGLVVGLLQSISQWLKPAQRSTRRGIAAAYLRSEAWAFLQGRDRYRGKDDRVAWGLLCDQINRVEAREAGQQDQEAAQVHQSYSVPH
ncbi:MAG TPA: hypothetical protein VMA77_03010 [Solirubrobacteraceae bacterium]|nr:hypothetical protein [Solirubrobacteraceae bacterium]